MRATGSAASYFVFREASLMPDYRIDSKKFLPRSMWATFDAFPDQGPCRPATVAVPLYQAAVALLTSGGLYVRNSQQPFDIEREKGEPLSPYYMGLKKPVTTTTFR
jgi:hypothetical protein